MSKILLTSLGMKGIGSEIIKILPKPLNELFFVHITTAANMKEERTYVTDDEKLMRDAGIKSTQLDIEGKNEDELRKILKDADVIYVQGGNTFHLLNCVRKSGFDTVIKELVSKGTIYIGVSAGSYIACPNIEPTTWKNTKIKTLGITDFTSLNLVDFLISAHYHEMYYNSLKFGASNSKYSVRYLNDFQAFYIDNGKVSLLGNLPETVLD